MHTDYNYYEEEAFSSGHDSEYSSAMTSSGSCLDKGSKPSSPSSMNGGFNDKKNSLIRNDYGVDNNEEQCDFMNFSKGTCEFPLSSIDSEAVEWCQNDLLGIRVSKIDNLIYLTFNSKTYECDLSTHTIKYIKPLNKCYFPKEERCYIRKCYDHIRKDYSLAKKDIAAVIYTAIYNFQDFINEGDSFSLAVEDIHFQFIQDKIEINCDKDYRNIRQLVYNLSRYDSFKEDFDYVGKWMEENLNYYNTRRAFNIVYCAYYRKGYDYASLSCLDDEVYHKLIDEIRGHVKESKKIPSAKSVQYSIGILTFDT